MASLAPEYDTIFINGAIRVSAQATGDVQALAVKDGKVAALGTSEELLKNKSSATKVVDLQGRRCVPGLIDAHCHPVRGVAASLFAVKLGFSDSPETIAEKLGEFIDKNPDAEFVMGGRYAHSFLHQYADVLEPTPREWLDKHSKDKTVYIREASGHGAWANSKALSFLGITKDSPVPNGGQNVKDETTGELTGILLGESDMMSRRKWPDWSAQQYDQAVREVCKLANSFGITGIKDADVSDDIVRAFRDADRAGDLTLHVSACFGTPFGHRDKPLDYVRIEKWRTDYTAPHVDTSNVKMYIDGVPMCESRTSCFVDPYLGNSGKFAQDHRGSLLCAPAILNQDLIELDRRGFTVKVHSIGDGAVRASLDAYEAARVANGGSGPLHEVGHTMFVTESDRLRFKKLNVVAEVSPYLWFNSPGTDELNGCIGRERMKTYYTIRSFLQEGILVAAGSDWPSASPSINPWIGLGTMVTRQNPYGETAESLLNDEGVSVTEALMIFTSGGAAVLNKAAQCGSLEVGKSADMAVLDRDIFAIDPMDISKTVVEMATFEGKVVFDRSAA